MLRSLAALLVLLFITLPSDVEAGIIAGTVEAWSPENSKLVVKTSSGQTKTFSVGNGATIEMNKVRKELTDIQVGATVSVYYQDSGSVYKIILRKAAGPAKKPEPNPEPMPENTPEPKPETRSQRNPRSNDTESTSTEWPGFQGINRANRSEETGLNKDWNRTPPKPAWRATGLGEGYSAVAIADGKVFTLGSEGNQEAVFALSLKDGKPLWSTPIGSLFREGTGNGPRSTPTLDGNKLYALSANGDLACLETSNGRINWQKNILQDFGGRNIVWGISESPLIDGEKLIVTPGGGQATMVALNKANGSVIWRCMAPGNPQAGYSSAIVVEVDGVKQYVNFTHRSLISVRASDGEFLWENNSSANGTANCSSPVTEGNMVFSATGYGTGGTMVQLTSSGGKTTARQVYHTDDMKNHHGGMVVVDGYLYGADEGVLTCIELKTGDVKWQNRSVGKGSITYADGCLYLRSERGPIALVEATPDGYNELGRMDQPERSNNSAWAHPVVADGKLFIRDQGLLLVWDLKTGR